MTRRQARADAALGIVSPGDQSSRASIFVSSPTARIFSAAKPRERFFIERREDFEAGGIPCVFFFFFFFGGPDVDVVLVSASSRARVKF